MKKIIISLFLTLAINSALHAEYDQIDFTNTELPNNSSDMTPGFLRGGRGIFALETNSDFISHSKFDKKMYKHESISFCGFDINGSAVFYYNKDYSEAANIELGYTRTNVHWKENPFFSQNIFHTATLSISAQTARMTDWLWKGKFSFNQDINHITDFQEYANFDCFIWGRNAFDECIGLHIGIIALTGMKIDHIYPIIGFDWIATERWKVNAVFPVDLSIVYLIDENFSVNLKGRAFESRFRVGENENLSRALLLYQNTGVELGVDYDLGDSIQSNIHVGQTFGGRIKIANRHNKHSRRFKFKSAPYVGAEFMLRY